MGTLRESRQSNGTLFQYCNLHRYYVAANSPAESEVASDAELAEQGRTSD